ncbi:hypothetical protein [Streptomyces sp. NPDC006285]|uniref:hypothetical protein n=1 Tax=Streptomyces sp. NPDC006285 TaxID=3364742 RepID=UPI00369B57FD
MDGLAGEAPGHQLDRLEVDHRLGALGHALITPDHPLLLRARATIPGTDFEDILREQPALTLAVIGMVIEGFMDTDMTDRLRLTHAAVRMHKTRFRKAL